MVITITHFLAKIYFSHKSSKKQKKKLALTFLYFLGKETWLDDSWKLIYINQSRYYNTWESSKMFNISSKYFSIFNNKPPANWVVDITRDVMSVGII